MTSLPRFFYSFLLAFSAVATASAQVSGGDITGTVTDPTGGIADGATVTLTNPATNSRRVVKTGAAGSYNLPALEPGVYNLRVEMPGFATETRNGIELQVGQVARIDFTLKAASARWWAWPEARLCCKPRPLK
jgi:hypothetical protein